MRVCRFEFEGLAELIARGFAVAGLEQRVGQVLVNIGAIWRKFRCLLEEGNGGVVIARSQRIEGLCEGFVRRIFRFLRQRNGGNQAKRCKPDGALPDRSVGSARKILNILSDHTNMRLCRTMFYVKDLDRMVSFYGETLGLKMIEETRVANFVEFDAGAVRFALHAVPREIADQIEISSPPKPREKCPVKLTFEVEVKRLQGLGVTMIERPWGAWDAVDPEGNIFGIE